MAKPIRRITEQHKSSPKAPIPKQNTEVQVINADKSELEAHMQEYTQRTLTHAFSFIEAESLEIEIQEVKRREAEEEAEAQRYFEEILKSRDPKAFRKKIRENVLPEFSDFILDNEIKIENEPEYTLTSPRMKF